jgi:ribosomal protein L11 methyltransferase
MLEGLPPNNASHVMRLRCDEPAARAIADLIFESFDPARVAASASEETASGRDWASGTWIVEAYFADAPDEVAVRDLVRLAAGAQGEALAMRAMFATLAPRDWIIASLDGLGAVRAGRFLVHGAHDRGRARAHNIALEIQAALAFGTGHHGTTRGCLLALDALLKRRRPRRVLDVGTGTGILALAAARALRRRVMAGDIDADCVTAARGNARLNGATPWLHPVLAAGARHRALQAGAPYDLIFANILARPLRNLAPELARLAGRGCTLVLSGLLAGDVAGVLAAYRTQGFALASRGDREGWATLALRRGGAAARAGQSAMDAGAAPRGRAAPSHRARAAKRARSGLSGRAAGIAQSSSCSVTVNADGPPPCGPRAMPPINPRVFKIPCLCAMDFVQISNMDPVRW